jgi:hypothetical protein
LAVHHNNIAVVLTLAGVHAFAVVVGTNFLTMQVRVKIPRPAPYDMIVGIFFL